MWRTGKDSSLRIVMAAALTCCALFICCCGYEKTYRLDYSGDRGLFGNARESYRPGQKVMLSFSDHEADPATEYSFYLDGDPVDSKHYDGKGYIVTFIMPEHDAVLQCIRENKSAEAEEDSETADTSSGVTSKPVDDLPESWDEGSLDDDELKELSREVNDDLGGCPAFIFTDPGDAQVYSERSFGGTSGEETSDDTRDSEAAAGTVSGNVERDRIRVVFTEGELYEGIYSLRYFARDRDFHREAEEFELKLTRKDDRLQFISNMPAVWTGKEDAAGAYGSILRMYYRELSEGCPGEETRKELGLPEKFSLFEGDFYRDRGHFTDHFGYYLKDIDRDGSEELFIGALPDDIVNYKGFMQLWTIREGVPVSLYSAGPEDDPVLLTDGRIAVSRQLNAFEGYKYRMYPDPEKPELLMEAGYTMRGEMTAEGPGNYKCRKYTAGEGWSDISWQEYEEASVAEAGVIIPWKPLSDIEKAAE